MNRSIKNKLFEYANAKQERKFIKEIRHNIKELNRSMENIERMIERSRKIMHQPTLTAKIDEKSKIRISNCSSFVKEKSLNPLFDDGRSISENKHDQASAEGVHPKRKLIKITLKSERSFNKLNPQLNHSIDQAHEIYHFSPQSTKRLNSLSTSSKNMSICNPESKNRLIIKPKHNRNGSIGNEKAEKSAVSANQKCNTSQKSAQQSKTTQCKTEYKHEDQHQSYGKLSGTYIPEINTKKQICIKLFAKQSSRKKQQVQFKQALADQGFKVEPPYLLKMKQLLRSQTEQTNQIEGNEKKSQFIEKISQYKFAENYLSKNEIWAIYDKLISENIPELKWPIVIVDEVYKKIQKSQ